MPVLCRLSLVGSPGVTVIVAAHTCAPVIAIAEKGAEMIMEDLAKVV